MLDADIQGCFNEIDHNALLAKLNTFPAIKKQIKAWLKVGILEDEILTLVEKDTPQGSLISPLLMNIAFHGMEQAVANFLKNCKIRDKNGKYVVKRRRVSSINTIRYADDFAILHENELVIKSCKEFIKIYFASIGLKLKESKTKIQHTLNKFEGEKPGFDFLGFNIKQYKISQYHIRKTKAALKYRTLIRPSKDKVIKHFKNIRNTEVLLMELNPKIIG